MLYSEFIEGTKAKDTEYNYRVYKQLEALYMENENLTKSDIYAAAAGLIDNSETEAEKEAAAYIENAKKEIKESREVIAYYRERIEVTKQYIEISTPEEIKLYKDGIKEYKRQIRKETAWIKHCEFFIGA